MEEIYIVIIAIAVIGLIMKIAKKALKLVFIIAIIGLVIFLIYNFKFKKESEASPEETEMSEETLENKKIAMIVAFKDFKDEEYFPPKKILEEAGAEIITCSDKEGMAIGANGGEAEIDVLLQNLAVSDFNAIVFIGGPGALEHLDNEEGCRVAQETVEADKVLAAICISPTILAKVGVLEGKRATVWASPLNRGPVKVLEENGAIFENKPVVIDGKIVTGKGPEAAEEFGKALVQVLQSE